MALALSATSHATEREPLAPAAPAVTRKPDVRRARAARADLEARLRFLEARICVQRSHAELWWGSWVSFYAAGALVQGTRAMLADAPADRADSWISAAKATAAALRYVLDPYGGVRGLEPPAAGVGEASRRVRLAHAERVLAHNAERTEQARAWYAHAINIVVNVAGGVIVAAGFDEPAKGFLSAGIGVAVGEVAILTSPWEADDDLADYRQRFGGRPPADSRRVERSRWRLQLAEAGGMLVGTF